MKRSSFSMAAISLVGLLSSGVACAQSRVTLYGIVDGGLGYLIIRAVIVCSLRPVGCCRAAALDSAAPKISAAAGGNANLMTIA
jgi:hypothetical protein